ncbi:MAG: hypothetical protein K6F88_07850 [Ruminococcus sp.]|nr:hypothetical protein [Ruminococcus sp.]
MKKVSVIFFLIVFTLNFVSCKETINSKNENYKNAFGYKQYVSDRGTGYKDYPYFNTETAGEENSKARKYFESNSRSNPAGFLYTDFEDGICINKYLGSLDFFAEENVINIPETIDGKPVVKLGSYIEKDEDSGFYDAFSPFGDVRNCTLNLPSGIKYIENASLWEFVGCIEDEDLKAKSPHIHKINVDDNNPYYSSKNGILLSKDCKTLLYDYNCCASGNEAYTVPDYVEVFAPMNGVSSDYEYITIPKNVKKIDTYIQDAGEEYNNNISVKGNKGTAAEKWAKNNNVPFVEMN